MRTRGSFALLALVVVACSAPPPQQPAPTAVPTSVPTSIPTVAPTTPPTAQPTRAPTAVPTLAPTAVPAAVQVAAPTCTSERDRQPTPAQTEGPFFKAGSPERTSLLEPTLRGTRLQLSGFVLSAQCQPLSRAKLDFWQADDTGNYDNAGFRLRGHQFTDSEGRYLLETIVPALYTGRTRHIHVKVQAPSGPVLTTQLYFAGEARNQSDGIFNPALAVELQDAADSGKSATFNFVVRAS